MKKKLEEVINDFTFYESKPSEVCFQVFDLFMKLKKAGLKKIDLTEELLESITNKINTKRIISSKKWMFINEISKFFAYLCSFGLNKMPIQRNEKLKKWQQLPEDEVLDIDVDELPDMEYDWEYLKKLGIEEVE